MKSIQSNHPINFLIHLGAGYCSEMPQYQKNNFKKIILVEGDKTIAEALTEQYGKSEQVKIVSTLVGIKTGSEPFYRFSLSDVNSLYKPNTLYENFPSIRLLDGSVCPVEDVAALIERLELDNTLNELVIDLPGNTFEILKRLETQQQLKYFPVLRVYLNVLPLYEGEVPSELVLAWLEEQGYELGEVDDQQDLERPCYRMVRSQYYLKSCKLAFEVESITSEKRNITKQLALLKSKFEEKEVALKNITKANDDFQKERKSMLLKINDLTELKGELEKDLQKKSKDNEQVMTEYEKLKVTLQSQISDFDSLKNEYVNMQEICKNQNSKIHNLKTTIDDLNAENIKNKEIINAEEIARNTIESKLKILQSKFDLLYDEKEKINSNYLACRNKIEEKEIKFNSMVKERDSVIVSNKSLTSDYQLLSKENESLKVELAELRNGKLGLIKRRDQLKKELEDTQQNLKELGTKFSDDAHRQIDLIKIQERMEHLFQQNRLHLEQASNALGQHITTTGQNATTEIRTYIQYQQELGNVSQSLHYQNHMLTPEYALFLKNKVLNKQYDVILNIGSEVVAGFIASQLQDNLIHNRRIAQDQSKPESRYFTPDDDDIPKRLIAFEHKKSACKDFEIHLEQQGLNMWVNVQFSPLIDFQFSGESYLFFDIRKSIARLAEIYENRSAKVLVLLSLDKNIKSLTPEACLPVLLQELASHQVELITHPVKNPRRNYLKGLWSEMLKLREVDYTVIEDDKSDTIFFSINQ